MEEKKYKEIVYYLKNIIQNTPWENTVFTVGGCVRDLLLRRNIKDIDIVIEKPLGGLKFAEWLNENGFLLRDPILYPNYGTSMFILKKFPDEQLEAVCTRKERYPDSSTRNPETAFGTLKEDCYRRDLTINSLYQNISTGKIIDLTGGINSMKDKLLITTSDPEVIFEDDPLRMLRIIRFWGRFEDWSIDNRALEAIKKLSGRLRILSQERITSELIQIITSNNSKNCLNLMKDLGVLEIVLPQVSALVGCKQGPQHFGDVFEHTLAVLEKVPSNPILRLSALLHDCGKPYCITYDEKNIPHFYEHEQVSAEVASKVLKNLKMSNDFIEDSVFLIQRHMIFKQCGIKGEKLKKKKLRKYMYLWGERRFMMLLDLIDADNRSHAEGYCLPDQIKEIKELAELEKSWFSYKFPITGEDIMRVKGVKPGKIVKQYKEYLLSYAFAHPSATKEDLLEELQHVKQNNLPKV